MHPRRLFVDRCRGGGGRLRIDLEGGKRLDRIRVRINGENYACIALVDRPGLNQINVF